MEDTRKDRKNQRMGKDAGKGKLQDFTGMYHSWTHSFSYLHKTKPNFRYRWGRGVQAVPGELETVGGKSGGGYDISLYTCMKNLRTSENLAMVFVHHDLLKKKKFKCSIKLAFI